MSPTSAAGFAGATNIHFPTRLSLLPLITSHARSLMSSNTRTCAVSPRSFVRERVSPDPGPPLDAFC